MGGGFDLDDSFESSSPDRQQHQHHHMYRGVEMSMLSSTPEGGGGGGGADHSELDDVYSMGGSDFSGGRAGKYQEQLQRLKASLEPDKQQQPTTLSSSSSPSFSDIAAAASGGGGGGDIFSATAVATATSSYPTEVMSNKSTSSSLPMATTAAETTPGVDPFQTSHMAPSSTSVSTESVYYSGLGGYVLQPRGDEMTGSGSDAQTTLLTSNTGNNNNTTTITITTTTINNNNSLPPNTERPPDVDDDIDSTDFQFAADFSSVPTDIPHTSVSAEDFPSHTGDNSSAFTGSGGGVGVSNDNGSAMAVEGSGNANSDAMVFEFDAFQEAPTTTSTTSASDPLSLDLGPGLVIDLGPGRALVVDPSVVIVSLPSMASSSSSSSSTHDNVTMDKQEAVTFDAINAAPAPTMMDNQTMSVIDLPSTVVTGSVTMTVNDENPFNAFEETAFRDIPFEQTGVSEQSGTVEQTTNAVEQTSFEQISFEKGAFEQTILEEEAAFADVSMTEFAAAPTSPPASSSSSTHLTVTDPSTVAPDVNGVGDAVDDFGGFEEFTAAPISPTSGLGLSLDAAVPTAGDVLSSSAGLSPSASASGRDNVSMGSTHSFDLLDSPDLTVGQGLGARVDSGLGLGLGSRVDSGLGLGVVQEDDPDDPFACLHGSLSNSALPSLV